MMLRAINKANGRNIVRASLPTPTQTGGRHLTDQSRLVLATWSLAGDVSGSAIVSSGSDEASQVNVMADFQFWL